MNEHDERLTAQHVAAYLPDYVNNRLPEAKRAEVEAHLRACLACRRECDEWRTLATAVRAADIGASPTCPSTAPGATCARGYHCGLTTPQPPQDGTCLTRATMMKRSMAPLQPLASGCAQFVQCATDESPWTAVGGRRGGLGRAHCLWLRRALLSGRRSAAPTGAATATPTAPSLTWVDVVLPVVPAGYAPAYPSVAPNDGNVAYACAVAQDTPNARPAVWRSGDRTRTWTRATDIPFTRGDIKSA